MLAITVDSSVPLACVFHPDPSTKAAAAPPFAAAAAAALLAPGAALLPASPLSLFFTKQTFLLQCPLPFQFVHVVLPLRKRNHQHPAAPFGAVVHADGLEKSRVALSFDGHKTKPTAEA